MKKFILALIILFIASPAMASGRFFGDVWVEDTDISALEKDPVWSVDKTLYATKANPRFTGTVGVGSTSPRGALDIIGDVYATYFHGNGSLLTGIPGGSGSTNWSDGTVMNMDGINWTDFVTFSGGGSTGGSVNWAEMPAETDPVWLAAASSYYTKTQIDSDLYLQAETDPVWISQKSGYYSKTDIDSKIYITQIYADSPLSGTGKPTDHVKFTNPGYLSAESDPVWSGVSGNYYTKTNIDGMLYLQSVKSGVGTNMTGLLRGNGSTITADTTVYTPQTTTVNGYALTSNINVPCSAVTGCVTGALSAVNSGVTSNITGLLRGNGSSISADTTVYTPQTTTVNGQALTGNVNITTISGNAGTATALQNDPADCIANQYANAINTSGALSCAQPSCANVTGCVVGAITSYTETSTLANVVNRGNTSITGIAIGTSAALYSDKLEVDGVLYATNIGINSSVPTGRLDVSGAGDTVWTGATSLALDSGMKLGVGTTAPQYTLDVEGQVYLGSTSNVGIATTTPAQKLHIEGNTYISGNLGVGSTQPTQKIDVGAGTIKAATFSGTATTASALSSTSLCSAGQGSTGINTSGAAQGCVTYLQTEADTLTTVLNRGSATYKTMAIGTTAAFYSDKLEVDGVLYATNIGVNSSSPATKLDVIGSEYVSVNIGIGSSGPRRPLEVTGIGYFSTNVGIASVNPVAQLDVSGAAYFHAGNVGISTTVPAQPLDVSGASYFHGGNVGVASVAPVAPLDVVGISYFHSGNVGINSTTVPQHLSVVGNAYFSGSVGIGSTGPDATLTVPGTIKVGANATNASAFVLCFTTGKLVGKCTALTATTGVCTTCTAF